MTTEATTARALKPEEIDLALLRRTCDTCECFAPGDAKAPAGQAQGGHCRSRPPHNTMVLVPRPNAIVGQMPFQDLNLSGWPIVYSDQWCIEGYRPIKGTQQ